METVTIHDDLIGDVEITGTPIGRITTEFGPPGREDRRPRDRWGEYRVWKLASGAYALVTEAMSRLYHTEFTACPGRDGAAGSPATVDDLPDDAMPCPRCRPADPDYLADGEAIRFEFPRRSVYECENPGKVRDKLMHSGRRGGPRSMSLDGPSRALIAACQRNDPDFIMRSGEAVKIA